MANRERMSGVDTAWLRMDHPSNLMMIVGVWVFEGKLDLRTVKRTIESRFLAFRRFRQKAVLDASGAWWEDDEDFDIDSHVQRIALPGRHGKRELEKLTSNFASMPLDPTKPLWQFHLVEDYLGGSALIMRIHHCYADGVALVQVTLSMTHKTGKGSLAIAHRVPEVPEPRSDADFWEQLLRPVSGALETAVKAGRSLLEQGKDLVSHPGMAPDVALDATRKGVDFASEVAKILTMKSDSPTRFKGPLGVRKRTAWAEPLNLEEVKVLGKALGCSINDVLLAMAAGALRAYLAEQGDPVEGLEFRGIVPVNLRPAGEGMNLGNHFGMVFLELPVGIEHPLERLYEVRRRMRELKGSYQPMIALGILSGVGYGPRILQDQVTQMLSSNATAVMTNVPGPAHPLYFAGQRVTELEFWVPQSGGIGMGISILSYNGRIHFGVITDVGLVPDPNRIVGLFRGEFDKLMWLTLMCPWGIDIEALSAEWQKVAKTAASKPTARRIKAAAMAAEAAPPPAARKVPKRFRNL
jgi:diacylglycerol O-acyltransferase / wax synthase